eukprot:1159843-Pelagomonas_calceolata.AAC.2
MSAPFVFVAPPFHCSFLLQSGSANSRNSSSPTRFWPVLAKCCLGRFSVYHWQSLAQAPARAVCWKASVPMCACLAPASAAFQKASDVCLFGTGTRKRFGDESEEEEEEVPGGAGWGGAAGGRRRSGSSAKRQRSSLQVRCGYACEGAGAMLWVSQWCKVNHSFTHALAYTYTFVGQLSSTGARQGERMRFLVHSRMQGLPSHANWKEAARSVVAALMKEPCAELFLEPVDEEVRKAGPPN